MSTRMSMDAEWLANERSALTKATGLSSINEDTEKETKRIGNRQQDARLSSTHWEKDCAWPPG